MQPSIGMTFMFANDTTVTPYLLIVLPQAKSSKAAKTH